MYYLILSLPVAKRLGLYQVLSPNAYSLLEGFVPILNKTVSSTVHEVLLSVSSFLCLLLDCFLFSFSCNGPTVDGSWGITDCLFFSSAHTVLSLVFFWLFFLWPGHSTGCTTLSIPLSLSFSFLFSLISLSFDVPVNHNVVLDQTSLGGAEGWNPMLIRLGIMNLYQLINATWSITLPSLVIFHSVWAGEDLEEKHLE